MTVLSLLGFLDKLTGRVAKELGVEADLGLSSIQKIGEQYEEEHFSVGATSESLCEHFAEVITRLCGEHGRIYVLIDDLDRCQPETAYKLLEGMKVYLSLPNCVFVLAIDHRQLERAIAQCLPGASKSGQAPGGEGDSIHQAREYLEKICQDVWHLPLVPIPKQEALLRSCLGVSEIGVDPAWDEIFALLSRYACLPANARKLKAYANTLRRFQEHCAPPPAAPYLRHGQLVAIMSCLYHFHPQIYRLLEANPAFYNEMLLWVQDPKPGHAVFEGIKIVSDTVSDRSVRMPDPAIGDFFRIARLVRDAADVTETEVKHHLLPYARTN